MSESTGWPALQRKLEQVLSPEEWQAFCAFCQQIAFDGEDFSWLSADELNELSRWADRAREVNI